MRAVVVADPGGEKPLIVVDLPDPGRPGPGQVRVRLHASSLNFHDNLVIHGADTPVGHIPLADGAGVVEETGAGVEDLAVGDHVIGAFFPHWADGEPFRNDFPTTPGIGAPGYAREVVVAPHAQFTRVPRGWSHAEAATLIVAGLTAWRYFSSAAHQGKVTINW